MKIAGVQMDIRLAQIDRNLENMTALLREARRAGASLAIFPECAVTGYCHDSPEAARAVAQPIPGPATERLCRACAELDCYAVFGMLEAGGKTIFNAAVLAGPSGLVASYRKVHLPYLGVDRFTSPGDRPFAVHRAGGLRVGLNICYDASFPESARALSLLGADLIALPTNWPPGSECVASHAIPTRALENGVYFAAVNRVGEEGGFTFIGGSRICDPAGNTMASAGGSEERILYADIEPERARCKHVVRVPGKHEIDRFADRRPALYEVLTRPHSFEGPRAKHRAEG